MLVYRKSPKGDFLLSRILKNRPKVYFLLSGPKNMYTKPKFSPRTITIFWSGQWKRRGVMVRGLAFLALISLVYHFVFPQYALADFYGQALLHSASPENPRTASARWVIVTAYSSTPDQTDSTPFITASGAYVRDGIVASNFLRFGTRVRFPELYGNKVFIVEDRMAKKNSHKIDIWFENRWQAINFGVKKTKIEILEN